MESCTLPTGSLLKHGEYKITGMLGQGGFGITYEAEQVSLGRKVAVKEFFMKDLCNRDESTSHVSVPSVGSKELVERFRQKFIREARTIAGLDNNHIVRIYDVFEENGTAYYVMEYLSGGSLDRKIRECGALSEERAVGYIRQIADSLQYLHSRSILHFDVKPSNVLLNENGIAKLIDFGISKHYDESGSQTSSTPVGISKGFAPLEQYQQGGDIKTFSPATDIYALGATLFALVTGNNPPEASIVNEDGVSYIDGISASVMHTIECAMQPKRKDRPQSVSEFLCLLDSGNIDETTVIKDQLSQGKSSKTKNGGNGGHKQTNDTSSGFPKWLYAVGAAVIAVLIVLLALRKPETNPDDSDVSEKLVAEMTGQQAGQSQPSSQSSAQEHPAQSTIPDEPAAHRDEPATIALQSLSLSKTSLELEEGQSSALTARYTPSNATDKSTTWESTDQKVAMVNMSGKVTAVKSGSAVIIATCQGNNAYCNVIVKQKPQEVLPLRSEPSKQEQSQAVIVANPQSTASSVYIQSSASVSASSTSGTHNGYEWVDLGLSVKWATCNVGASVPSEYGSYFAWGETSTKNNYNWESLKYCTEGNYSNVNFSKYVVNSDYGSVDNKRVLDLSDDAARANWGGSWRMPTEFEFKELIDRCTWKWTTQNYLDGYLVVSKVNSNSIFLPAAGYRSGTGLSGAGWNGLYWSSSLDESDSRYERYVFFSPDTHKISSSLRWSGESVRPVLP